MCVVDPPMSLLPLYYDELSIITDVWFQQTKAQFTLRGVTEQTIKYYYLLATLDPITTEKVAKDVAVTPAHDQYLFLKKI